MIGVQGKHNRLSKLLFQELPFPFVNVRYLQMKTVTFFEVSSKYYEV